MNLNIFNKLTKVCGILFVKFITEKPSGSCPILQYEASNVAELSVITKSKSGKIVKPISLTEPRTPATNGLEKAAKLEMKFLKKKWKKGIINPKKA